MKKMQPTGFGFKSLLVPFILLFIFSAELQGAAGDTITVQAFTFGSSRDSVIDFPAANIDFEKIYMYYTLKCNPAQNPACGEWDYLTYTYIYIPIGLYDSTVLSLDTVSIQPLVVDTTWDVFEVTERFELGRYITPYGNGLDLGAGFTWVFDVSDYRTLLTESRRITAGNWQELLDLKFVMIEGTPPRDPISVQNLWNGTFNLSDIDQTISAKQVTLNPVASTFRLKSRASGHAFSNPTGCAEFCSKNHSWVIDGTKHYEWPVWDECADNPLYPQGGTWIFDRAGWCPGAVVTTYDHELTPFVTPGSTILLDYDSETDPYGNYRFASQLISYGPPNFTNDTRLDEIIAPSQTDIFARRSLVCSNPVIRIQNTGSDSLTSVLITYGVVGGSPCYYLWEGNLGFLDKEEVMLPNFNWSGYNDNKPEFYATVSYPNNKMDQYEPNNTATAPFSIPPVMPGAFVIITKPDNYWEELSYTIEDEAGNVIDTNPNFNASSVYRDTIVLEDGCYTLNVSDAGEDGLGFWFYNALDQDNAGEPGYTPYNVGTGAMQLRQATSNSVIKNFDVDFGVGFTYSFTVGNPVGKDTSTYQCDEIVITPTAINEALELNGLIRMYPNPSSGLVNLEMHFAQSSLISIKAFNALGEEIINLPSKQIQNEKLQIDLSKQNAGLYFISIFSDKGVITKQVVKN